MKVLATITGIIGGLCAIIGILNASDVFTTDMKILTIGWEFWLAII